MKNDTGLETGHAVLRESVFLFEEKVLSVVQNMKILGDIERVVAITGPWMELCHQSITAWAWAKPPHTEQRICRLLGVCRFCKLWNTNANASWIQLILNSDW